jgi:hypothetical protein
MGGGTLPLLMALVAGGGLRVESRTPDALCPDLAQVRAAIQARLGDVEGGGEWLASYTLVHHPDSAEGDVVRLELSDPTGRSRLRRDLPRAGASCEAVAQAMVVVLESYFRRPGDAENGGTAAAAAAAISTVAAAPPVPLPPPPPRRAPATGPAVVLLAGWAGGPSSPAVAVDLQLAGRAPWVAGIEAAWLLASQSVDDAGIAATLQSYAVRSYFAGRLRLADVVRVSLGPAILLVIDRAEAAGLDGGAPRLRAAFGGGLRGEVQLRLAPRLALTAVAEIDWTPRAWAGYFTVDDAAAMRSREIFPAPASRLLVGAGLSLALFR